MSKDDILIPKIRYTAWMIMMRRGYKKNNHPEWSLSENIDKKTFIIYSRFNGMTVAQAMACYDERVKAQQEVDEEIRRFILEGKNE